MTTPIINSIFVENKKNKKFSQQYFSACLVWFYLSFCWILSPEGSIILLPYGWGQKIFSSIKCGYRHSLRLMTILAAASKPITSNTAIHPQPPSQLPLLPIRPLVSPRSIFSLQHETCLLVIHQSALYPQQDQPPLGESITLGVTLWRGLSVHFQVACCES